MRLNPPRPARTFFVLYLLFMLSITLLIFHVESPAVSLRPFESIARDWREGGPGFWVNLVGNVVAFVPIGGLLPAARGRARPTSFFGALAFGAAFSVTIEAAQYLSGLRTCDIDDVLLNTLGAALGYGLRAAGRRSRRG